MDNSDTCFHSWGPRIRQPKITKTLVYCIFMLTLISKLLRTETTLDLSQKAKKGVNFRVAA